MVTFVVDTPLFFQIVYRKRHCVRTFLMFRETLFDESQNSQQAYQAGLNNCKDSYWNSDVYHKKNEYEKCINSVQTEYAKNIEK